MVGFRISDYKPNQQTKSTFQQLFEIFKEMLVHTSGDVTEALNWLNEVDREYKITNNEYTMADFIDDLKKLGYLKDEQQNGNYLMSAKLEQSLRESSLEQIFGKLKKSGQGNHTTPYTGKGDEASSDLRAFQFGDSLEQINMTESIRNAQINNGSFDFNITENDLEIVESEHRAQTSTVLMIDISHSMILYGEDRITPSKKVAMAMAEMIKRKYPKDTLDIIVFGNDAWQIQVKDLPYLQVGPYHTNTVAGLELAMDLLRRKKNKNKQIFMITDGKPSCLKEPDGRYYQNSFGLDRRIVNQCLNMAAACKKLKMQITTFMIAKDPYLQQFVEEFTEANQGKAFYAGLKGLGEFIFEDYERNRKRNVR
ncbi:MAG TPA: VWA domain-containing protein [Bacteroidia bacterium]|nr:VWA domain-containing protein [Bacteroidia bacterium]